MKSLMNVHYLALPGYKDNRRVGGGGGVLHQIFKTNWTQLDLRFCKNEVSKRFKINEKAGQLD